MHLNFPLTRTALAAKYACYVIGYDWRVANGLPGEA